MNKLYGINRKIKVSIVLVLSALMLCSTFSVYAKEIGEKNEAAWERVDAVLHDKTPSLKDYSSTRAGNQGRHGDDLTGQSFNDVTITGYDGAYSKELIPYDDVLDDGTVFRGGNSESRTNSETNHIDNDVTDFASVLPYGTVFIDTSKITFDETNKGNFLVDINDSRFAWAVNHNACYSPTYPDSQNTCDREGHTPTIITGYNNTGNGTSNLDASNGIVYTGGLKAYLSQIDGKPNQDYVDALSEDTAWEDKPQTVSNYDWLQKKATENGYQNVIEPTSDDYLYRFVFYDAAVLPDGTKGDLEIKTKKLTMESTIDAQPGVVIAIQDANWLQVGESIHVIYDEAHPELYPAEITGKYDPALANYVNGSTSNRGVHPTTLPANVSANGQSIQAAVGAQTEIEIVVRDKEGNPVQGEISYSVTDLDIFSFQSRWGRPSNTWQNSPSDAALIQDYMFAEGLTITKGSLSYAVTPRYEHHEALEDGASDDTRNARGEIIANRWNPNFISPLQVLRVIEKEEETNNANGVRFVTTSSSSGRKFDGTYVRGADTSTTIPDGRYNYQRNDGGFIPSLGRSYSFDSGFATLIDPKGTSMTWTGSTYTQMATLLFDTSTFTMVKQSHGTGGGIYLEGYSLSKDGVPTRYEGLVTMGIGVDATVTFVPEDGHRVKEFYIDGKKFEITDTGVKLPSGTTQAFGPVIDSYVSVDGSTKTRNIDRGMLLKAEDLDITDVENILIEKNDDGTFDVTFKNLTRTADEDYSPKDIHVDFTADYYFYKVWKGNETPTDLTMTAKPYAFVFKNVKIDGKQYTFNGNKLIAPDGTETNYDGISVTIGENDNAKVYYLEGNKFVHYDRSGDEPVIDETYTIRLDYQESGNSVKFTVTADDANDDTETNVIKEVDDDGYTIWKIRYPSDGYTTKSGEVWPKLPIEKETTDHTVTHIERNYWFATEEATGWALTEYDNSEAEAPGKIDAAKDRKEIYKEEGKTDLSAWASASIKDYEQAQAVIKNEADNARAYMSVFSDHEDAITKMENTWGGKIVNIPALVVNAEKTWEDYSNKFETRQDVWFHIDAGDEEDVLPPQKLKAGASGNEFKFTWGDYKAYGDDYLSEYEGYENVKVIGKSSDLPSKDSEGNDIFYKQDETNRHKHIPMIVAGFDENEKPIYVEDPDGIVYYLNELANQDEEGKKITYTLRETDADGNDLSKADDAKFLIGYTSEVGDLKEDEEPVTISGVEMDSYTGEIKNTLVTKDFTVTKIFDEAGLSGGDRTHPNANDEAKLKAAFTLQESDEEVTLTALTPSGADAYDSTAKTGTLEVNPDGDKVTFTWHNIPKYALVKDDESGKVTGSHEAEYSVVEQQLNGYAAPVYSGAGKALNNGTITNRPTPPKGTPKETWGEKGAEQTTNGKDLFTTTTENQLDGTPNTIDKVELLDKDGNPADSVKVDGGTYTIDNDGKITFTPDPDFVGTAPPVTVRGTDSNGLSTTTKYTPHILDTEKVIKRTIEYFYSNGDPVLDGEGNPKTIEQEVTFKGVVNPETGEIYYPGNPTDTFDEVASDEISGYTVDKEKVNEITVRPSDNDFYEKVIYSPLGVSGAADESYGLPGKEQTGTPSFEMQTPEYTDGTPNKVTVKLVDPDTGEQVDEVTIDGQGTYKLNDDGTITFTPEDGYVGNPDPVEVIGTDRFGSVAKTTYTPHVVDPFEQGRATRTVHYTYETEEGNEVTDSIIQSVILYKHAKEVDPETGEVLEWGDWEPQKFPAVENPDDRVDQRIWTANSKAGEQTVTEPGDVPDVHVVYKKEPYTVIYANGDHGKSDGKGNQPGEEYDSDVTGGNGVTPDKGYHFTGKYKYEITDKNGKVIETGETDDPTSLKVIGNIVFTPQYEPNKYTIKYDGNGGKGKMDDQHFTGEDDSANSKDNEFTRKGYKFIGYKAKLPDGSYIKDKDGNDMIFESEADFIEYLHELGDGAEITLVAQWEKIPPEDKDDDDNGESGDNSTKSGGTSTGDYTNIIGYVMLLIAAAIAYPAIRRKRIK